MRFSIIALVAFVACVAAAPSEFPDEVANLIARACPAKCAVSCVCSSSSLTYISHITYTRSSQIVV